VMKVIIPANPILVGDASQKFVDVHLATPYGVTQHLLIPVCSPPAGSGGQGATGILWKPTDVELAFVYGGLGITPPSAVSDPRYRPPSLVIQKGDVDPNKYDTVDVTLRFAGKDNVAPILLPGVAFDPNNDGYVISGDRLVGAVFPVAGTRFGPEATNPPFPLKTAATELTFKSSKKLGPDLARKASNSLTIRWIKAP
jgi:hypothetical protein